MMGAAALFLVASFPVFQAIVDRRSLASLLIGTGILSMLHPSTIAIAVTEGLPKRLRSASVGIIYAIAIAIVGTVTQPSLAWLIRVTGDARAPAYYLMCTTLIGLAAMIGMRETAPLHRTASGSA